MTAGARTVGAAARPDAPVRADLVRRLGRVLETAEHVLDRLAMDGWTDPLDAASSVRPEKVVSETALLLLAASAVPGEPALARRVDELARRTTAHARGARMRAGVCFEPALALDYAQAHACLRRMGHGDASFDTLLQAATRAQAFAVRERVPHRALEQCWVAELCELGTPAGWPSVRALAAMSALGRPLDLVGASREDLYAFTHALMYLKDPHLADKPLPRPRAEILRDAEAALVRCLADEDYDLAGELLLAWPLTGARFGGWSLFAWRTLAAVEDAAGFLPSPGTRLAHLARLPAAQRTDALLASAYHTVYVMGLLCAACLARGCLPPDMPSIALSEGDPAGAGARRRWEAPVAAAPAPRGASGHWAAVYARLDAPERAALGGFMQAVTLHRAVRARDVAAIHAALATAAAAGVADGPLWSQAAELLERLVAHAAPTVAGAPKASGLHAGCCSRGVSLREPFAAYAPPRGPAGSRPAKPDLSLP
jgi:hypothetical protein